MLHVLEVRFIYYVGFTYRATDQNRTTDRIGTEQQNRTEQNRTE